MAWFDNPVTQGYGANGETGVDIGTPFHTPITLPYGGTVVNTGYADYGGLVQIASNIPGLGNVVQSFVHLDLINVAKGAVLSAGSVIGISGGENPGYPGAIHPAQPQFSSGAHTEYNLSPTANIWNGSTINPLSYLRAGSTLSGKLSTATQNINNGTSASTATGASNAAAKPCNQPKDWWDAAGWGSYYGCQLFGGPQGQNYGDGGAGTADFVSQIFAFVGSGLEKTGFFVLAVVIIILGIVLIAYEPLKEGAVAASKAAVLA